MENNKSDLVCMGMITSPHGVKGSVKVKSYTEESEDLFLYEAFYDEDQQQQVRLEPLHPHKDLWVCRIVGVNDRDQALVYQGMKLYISRALLPEIEDEDAFYYSDLVGLNVYVDGKRVGSVKQVLDYGAGSVLELLFEENGKTELFSFTKENFPSLSLEERTLLFSPPSVLVSRDEDGGAH